MPTLTVIAPDGVPEVAAGADLADLLLPLVTLEDGDIVVVTSKVVSKAEGRVVEGDREDWITAETTRLVARRGPTRIVRNRLGLTMAAAGVDASNVARGAVVLLPAEPDASAARLRAAIAERTGRNVGVVVTDTAGRAWREGQTDIAIGAAGVVVLESYAGRLDEHGNELAVTAPAVADEVASVAELAQGKLGGRPFAVVRGRTDLVLAPGDDGTGARALIRADGGDLFGYGAREAVVRAVLGDPSDAAPFGAPSSPDELAELLRASGFAAAVEGDSVHCPSGPDAGQAARATVLAFAHGWLPRPTADGGDLRFHRSSP
ncbi:coenzyme F420-0:L-glutamate ligase [Nocardioides sp. MH1]|uniref:coenzyme F420-0:L-glutamate ligase n=1 Tax=Nocardioides sp. MH1 TaxID=3242490 RepID=UPI0035209DE8